MLVPIFSVLPAALLNDCCVLCSALRINPFLSSTSASRFQGLGLGLYVRRALLVSNKTRAFLITVQ